VGEAVGKLVDVRRFAPYCLEGVSAWAEFDQQEFELGTARIAITADQSLLEY